MADVDNHRIVSHDEWIAARKALLAKEKEFNRMRDALSAERRELPWERVTKSYVFDGPRGDVTLEQLFDGRSQLVVYHAMFDPKTVTPRTPYTAEAPCSSCSFWMDNFERVVVHLAHRDVTLVAASRAPIEKLDAFKKRMGWTFEWVSVGDGDFNRDYGVTLTADEIENGGGEYNYAPTRIPIAELPGISVFYKDAAQHVFHTYSTYARGLDMLNVGYHYLDIVPKGRDEGSGGARWVRRRDEYADAKAPSCH
ncbi:MAG TPA: thioredoxin family protein [Minicystis sp.]|nr:thioredoxin family protein [Minicystis sp.]